VKPRVRPSALEDAADLAANISDFDREDLLRGWGVTDCEGAIAESMEESGGDSWSIVDDDTGHVLAVFGASRDGIAWLVVSRDFDRIVLRFVRQSRKYIAELLGRHGRLYNYAYAGNERMIRWLEWCGFTLDEPINGYRRFELCAQ
jgi:RimJ/RimL family protein N-acetyltransferase